MLRILKKWNWDNAIALFLVFAFVLLAGWIIIQAGVQIATKSIEAFTDVAVAIIAAASAVLASVFKHSFDLEKNREQEQYLSKQTAYKELLGKIAVYIRVEGGEVASADAFSTAHLASWAFGDPEVVLETSKFMEYTNPESLKALLKTVRKSLGTPELPDDFFDTYKMDKLFERRGDRYSNQ